MKRIWLVGAALALTIVQPDDASAQRGGVRAGGGSSGFRGVAMAGGYRGVTMHGAAVHGGIWRSGWGWRYGWRLPVAIGIAAGTLGYYNEPNNDPCLFLTHHGWINTCF
jgi:uncharacterized membrane protein